MNNQQTTTNNHTFDLTLPAPLIDWAQTDPLSAPYAAELEALAAGLGGTQDALGRHEAVRVLSCIEAVVYGACGAQRADLLMDLPVWLARLLGLRFAWSTASGGRVEVGGREGWDAAEAALRWARDQGEREQQALSAMRAVGETFGVGAIQISEQRPCDRCGARTVASVDMEDDSRYCGSCWSSLAGPATVPAPVPAPARPTKRRT
jgi:hypothetical protein